MKIVKHQQLAAAAQAELESMFTEVLIPVEPAPEDPLWIIKKKSGKKLNGEEADEYMKWKHDQNFI